MRRRNWNFPAKNRLELRRRRIIRVIGDEQQSICRIFSEEGMMTKQLIVVVEGTGAMGPFWKTIISDYLEKMIRSFTEADSIEQKPSAGDVELSLVVFNVHDSCGDCMLQRSGWTRDIDMFFQLLSALPFSGGGFNDVAAAEGLASALMMFSSLNGSQQTQQNADGHRHCILVAASNPYPLPTPVYYPAILNLEQSENIVAHTSLRMADAETIAKAFPQCSVSLSVICPRKLPKLRAIYNAGKRDPQAADPLVDTSKNPDFLVLISENFSKDCAAFSRTEMESLAPNQSLVEMDMSFVPPISGPAAPSNPSVMNQQPILAGNIPAPTVNIEPTMVYSVSGPASPHIPTAHRTSQLPTTLQSGSPISVFEEMVPSNDNTMEPTMVTSVSGPAPPHIPTAHPISQVSASLQSGSSISISEEMVPNNENTMEPITVTSVSGPAPPHIPTAHPTSQVSASLQSGSYISISEEMVPNNENTKETTPIVCVMTQSLGPFGGAAVNVRALNGVASAISAAPAVLTSGQLGSTSMTGFASFARTDHISQIFGPASLTVMAPSMFGNSNLCMSQPLSNTQRGSRGNLLGSQIMQSGIDMHQDVLSGISTGMPLGQLLSNFQGAIGAGSQTAPVISQGFLPGSQMMQSGVGMLQNVPSGMDTSMSSGQLLSNIQGVIGTGSLTAPVMSQGNLPGSQMMQSGIGMHQNVPSGMDTSMPSGQLLSIIQGRVGARSLTEPVMSRGNLPRSQMMPSGIGMHQNVPSGMGTGMPSEIGTMMPTPGMTQQGQPEILPLGRNNSAEANMSLSQQQTLATSSSAQSGYVKIWEGNLSLVREGEPEHILRLQGYKRSSASESLAANFPQTLQILHLIPKDHMIQLVRQRTGKPDILAFWAINGHAVLNCLQKENVAGLISLPSKALFVYVSDKSYRLIGLLLPNEHIPNQQLQEQPCPQVQQLQEQPGPQVQQLQEQPLSQEQQLQAQLIPDADWDDEDFLALRSVRE